MELGAQFRLGLVNALLGSDNVISSTDPSVAVERAFTD